MKRVLHVAEKPSAARSIAEIISKGSMTTRKGLSKYNHFFEFEGPLKTTEHDRYQHVVTSVTGHIKELSFANTEKLKNWSDSDPIILFDEPLVKNIAYDKKDLARQLQMEAQKVTIIVLWLDCDREGENIATEVLDVCRSGRRKNFTVYRAHFSSFTQGDIIHACNTLGQLDYNASAAIDARQELDLRIGSVYTRLQTLQMKKAGQVVSYGPCQFPTLRFVVERFWEAESFVPEQFWGITARYKVSNAAYAEPGEAVEANFLWNRGRLFDRLACTVLYEQCVKEPLARVVTLSCKEKRKYRPFPLTTVTMQKLAAKKLKISSENTMKIAERLYQAGYISYPRTETDQFPQDFDYNGTIGLQSGDARWGNYAKNLLDGSFEYPKAGSHSDNAHPPIYPCKSLSGGGGAGLAGDDLKLYEFVTRHFLACCSKDAIGDETHVEIEIAGERFHSNGLVILARNYLDVYPYDKWNSKSIPMFREGETFTPEEILMTEGTTTAPSLLSEHELISLMDKNGIGTDATIAEHIQKIQERNYVTKIQGDLLAPEPLGIGLIEGYDAMGLPDISKPKVRADMEAEMVQIAAGTKNPRQTVTEVIGNYRRIYTTAQMHIRRLVDFVNRRLTSPSQLQIKIMNRTYVPPPPPSYSDDPFKKGDDDNNNGFGGGSSTAKRGGRGGGGGGGSGKRGTETKTTKTTKTTTKTTRTTRTTTNQKKSTKSTTTTTSTKAKRQPRAKRQQRGSSEAKADGSNVIDLLDDNDDDDDFEDFINGISDSEFQ